MNRRSVLLGALAWIVVVSLGATAVWWVISRAGEGVAGELPATTATAAPVETGGPVQDPGTGAGTPTATGSADGPVTRTYRGAAGSVVTSCTGPAVALVRARPADGWRLEVADQGPDRVRVELEAVDESASVRVESVCVDGVPVFTDESETENETED